MAKDYEEMKELGKQMENQRTNEELKEWDKRPGTVQHEIEEDKDWRKSQLESFYLFKRGVQKNYWDTLLVVFYCFLMMSLEVSVLQIKIIL